MKAVERQLVFVNLKGSEFIHAVITPEYYNIMIKENHRAPAGIYEDAEYQTYSVPFTFTTLNQFLPFRMTSVGGFRLLAENASRKDRAIVKFHQQCLETYHKYSLNPKELWFDYINHDKEYATDFKNIYEEFRQLCVPST